MKLNRKILTEAMFKARESFTEHLEEKDLDPAYFKLNLTGFLLDYSFKEYMFKVTLESDPIIDQAEKKMK